MQLNYLLEHQHLLDTFVQGRLPQEHYHYLTPERKDNLKRFGTLVIPLEIIRQLSKHHHQNRVAKVVEQD